MGHSTVTLLARLRGWSATLFGTRRAPVVPVNILAKSLLVSIAWLVACSSVGERDAAPAVADAAALDAGAVFDARPIAVIDAGAVFDASPIPVIDAGAVFDAPPGAPDAAVEPDAGGIVIPVFTRHPSNPVFERESTEESETFWDYDGVRDPSVLHMGDGSWVMYYTGNDGAGPHYRVGRAVSTDGVAWTTPGPVLTGFGPSVLHDGTQFRAWVTSYYDDAIYQTSSADGVTWGDGGIAVAPGSHPSVLQEGTAFRMWYGYGDTRHATSIDGLTWTKDPDSYFAGGGRPTVIADEGIYKMWFVKAEGIYYATSADGLTWTEHGLSLANGPAGSWDEVVSSPMVVRDGGVLEMWYSGIDGDYVQPHAIGYATYP